ncbi:MAG: hypothetical protein ABEH78_05630 [Haloferacaceae archaeon]
MIVNGEEVYRLRIGRTHTAFYTVVEEVRVVEIMDIEKAHDRYGFD